MKLGKLQDEKMLLVDVEKGIEVEGSKTEKLLLNEGYKPICEFSGEGIIEYLDCGDFYVLVYNNEKVSEQDSDA